MILWSKCQVRLVSLQNIRYFQSYEPLSKTHYSTDNHETLSWSWTLLLTLSFIESHVTTLPHSNIQLFAYICKKRSFVNVSNIKIVKPQNTIFPKSQHPVHFYTEQCNNCRYCKQYFIHMFIVVEKCWRFLIFKHLHTPTHAQTYIREKILVWLLHECAHLKNFRASFTKHTLHLIISSILSPGVHSMSVIIK